MPAVHLIKKEVADAPSIHQVPNEENVYTSGFWTMSEATANSLIGGQIYFHERQVSPSFLGGEILEATRLTTGEHSSKVVFKFRASQDCSNITTSLEGWSQEMKLIR